MVCGLYNYYMYPNDVVFQEHGQQCKSHVSRYKYIPKHPFIITNNMLTAFVMGSDYRGQHNSYCYHTVSKYNNLLAIVRYDIWLIWKNWRLLWLIWWSIPCSLEDMVRCRNCSNLIPNTNLQMVCPIKFGTKLTLNLRASKGDNILKF